jgi:hypothetical protein
MRTPKLKPNPPEKELAAAGGFEIRPAQAGFLQTKEKTAGFGLWLLPTVTVVTSH